MRSLWKTIHKYLSVVYCKLRWKRKGSKSKQTNMFFPLFTYSFYLIPLFCSLVRTLYLLLNETKTIHLRHTTQHYWHTVSLISVFATSNTYLILETRIWTNENPLIQDYNGMKEIKLCSFKYCLPQQFLPTKWFGYSMLVIL